jgi:hypothetical protein
LKSAVAYDYSLTFDNFLQSIQDVIVSLTPSKGSARGGSMVTVHGFGFNALLSYTCLFGGEHSAVANVKSAFELVCTVAAWPIAATSTFFELLEGQRGIDRMSIRGVLEYFVTPQPLPYVFFAEAISISPSYMDRLGGSNGGSSPEITITGAGFNSSHTYRCNVQSGDRKLQTFVTRALSSTSIVCDPPEWDLVTKSAAFESQDANVTLYASDEAGWSSMLVYSLHPFALQIVQVRFRSQVN